MWRRPIHKLALRGSVRQLHAIEVFLERYVGLVVGLGVSTWVFWQTPGKVVTWIAYLAVVAAVVAIVQPWHRELHLSMDSDVLRFRRVAFGVVPLGSRDHSLEGRRLAVERRVVPTAAESDHSGCLIFFLPFPLGWIVSGLRSPKDSPSHVTQWVLCLRGSGYRTDDLALLKSAPVAARFLAAAEEILPEHVERN